MVRRRRHSKLTIDRCRRWLVCLASRSPASSVGRRLREVLRKPRWEVLQKPRWEVLQVLRTRRWEVHRRRRALKPCSPACRRTLRRASSSGAACAARASPWRPTRAPACTARGGDRKLSRRTPGLAESMMRLSRSIDALTEAVIGSKGSAPARDARGRFVSPGTPGTVAPGTPFPVFGTSGP